MSLSLDVLSGARLGTTRLYCLEAAGGLLYCVEARVKEQGEHLSCMAGWTVRGGGRKLSSPWRESSMDGTRNPPACYTQ